MSMHYKSIDLTDAAAAQRCHGASTTPSISRNIRQRLGSRPCSVALALALSSASCASEPKAKQTEYPHSSDLMCRYIGLSAVSADQHETSDSVTLLAVYRFSAPHVPAPREPLSLKFEVARSRVDDLRGHLEAHPEVICHPGKQANYEVQLEPFGGIQGEPQP